MCFLVKYKIRVALTVAVPTPLVALNYLYKESLEIGKVFWPHIALCTRFSSMLVLIVRIFAIVLILGFTPANRLLFCKCGLILVNLAVLSNTVQ